VRRRNRGANRGLQVSVNNRRCHRYGICQAEAEEIFWLGSDGRLRYDTRPPPELHDQARMAARLCPMQAIVIEERIG